MNSTTVKISIPSDVNMVSPIREFIAKVIMEHDFNEEISVDVEMAISEALTNIIEHNYRYVKSYRIDIVIIFEDDKYTINIYDEGKVFDPTRVKVPSINAQKRKKDFHLGTLFIKKCMDEVKYSSLKKGKNLLTMVKYKKSG